MDYTSQQLFDDGEITDRKLSFSIFPSLVLHISDNMPRAVPFYHSVELHNVIVILFLIWS